jgi:E3 ubiquitin-protein ligase BRE1
MKSKDQIHAENRALKQQLTKTAEVITKVQEGEKSLVQKVESLERQVAITDNIRSTLEKKLSEMTKKENEQRISLQSVNSKLADVI